MTQRYLPETWETSNWLVISPHLDDAVFSCGRLLASAPGAVVVTVFAGIPPDDVAAPPWDEAAGFASGNAAMQARRAEDRSALELLGAEPVWLPFLDRQYVEGNTPDAIAPALKAVMDQYPERRVLSPLGLFHSDHALVFDAVWTLLNERAHALVGAGPEPDPGMAQLERWWFYEDMPYRRLSGLVGARIAAWRNDGYAARRVDPVLPELADADYAVRKVQAMEAYESQLGLLDPEALIELNTSESYWQLQWSPVSR
ncbi:hypothetical protein AB870_22650 [Pandoraea faecigallinarum]|uniref:GlcNAc-PI de-N-acetylase n=1 Tax=Pandoraea faecigallinarum TaxID=656179 RepID=A0A0H3WVR7_9BURK|nr:PIG-L family deacetylase [Pandoraea faecigallinarum]AKM32299.1 hypothetical protein AB870_22650 [Pandoraea faecigallinarum]